MKINKKWFFKLFHRTHFTICRSTFGVFRRYATHMLHWQWLSAVHLSVSNQRQFSSFEAQSEKWEAPTYVKINTGFHMRVCLGIVWASRCSLQPGLANPKKEHEETDHGQA